MRQACRWFPAEPAAIEFRRRARASGRTLNELAEALRMDRRTFQRLTGKTLIRSDAADRVAVAMGCHPAELWPDWFGSG